MNVAPWPVCLCLSVTCMNLLTILAAESAVDLRSERPLLARGVLGQWPLLARGVPGQWPLFARGIPSLVPLLAREVPSMGPLLAREVPHMGAPPNTVSQRGQRRRRREARLGPTIRPQAHGSVRKGARGRASLAWRGWWPERWPGGWPGGWPS